jgi:hypothetical protein
MDEDDLEDLWREYQTRPKEIYQADDDDDDDDDNDDGIIFE